MQNINTFRIQPCTSNVYINTTTYKHIVGLKENEAIPLSFIAHLKRLVSPSENEKLLKSALKTEENHKKSNNNQLPKSVQIKSEKTVVRVIVDDESVSSGVHHILVSDVTRRWLNLELYGRVELNSLTQDISPDDVLARFILNPIYNGEEMINNDDFLTAFKLWCESVFNEQQFIIINNHMPIELKLSSDLSVICWVSYECHDKITNNYCVLNPDMLNSLSIQVVCNTECSGIDFSTLSHSLIDCSQLDSFKTKPINLGGIDELFYELTNSVQEILFLSCNTSKEISGGILLCGAKGIGKTSVCKQLSYNLSSEEKYIYVTYVDGKMLKGKKPESIKKILESTFVESIWRKPSLIILDNLDQVLPAEKKSEQEISGEAVYFAKISQVFCEFFKQLSLVNCGLSFLCTCISRSSLHSFVTPSAGNHIFSKTFVMPLPNSIQRKEILKSIIASKVTVDSCCFNELNTQKISDKLEGFVCSDLVNLVDRALHSRVSQKQNYDVCGGIISLSDEDFEVAIQHYKPSALRNVPLHSSTHINWEDVGGLAKVKECLIETLLWPLKFPGLFAQCPLRLQSGVLLYGAPGTGKTLLAAAFASHCKLNFISIKGPELLSKYIGGSEMAVRNTIKRAQMAKPCILFFDEFDSLAPRRGHDSTGVTDRVVNQLLTELDGVEGLSGVYILAATSRPDLIDPALLRPGRLDKSILCPVPSNSDRLEILNALTRNLSLDTSVDLFNVASRTKNFTGADIKALLYDAQLQAIHNKLEIKNELTDTTDGVTDQTLTKSYVQENSCEKSECSSVYVSNPVLIQCSKEHLKNNLTQRLKTSLDTIMNKESSDWLNNKIQSSTSPSLESEHTQIIVNNFHIEEALKRSRPSLANSERLRYNNIYRNFPFSQTDVPELETSTNKRVTLA